MAKKNSNVAQTVGIGVGLTAAAVAAAGAYFLYGSDNAAKNRKKVKSWALKAKAEVLEALEKADGITQDEYNALIDAIGGAYTTVKGASRGEIADFKKEMKAHWKKIEKTGPARAVKKQAANASKSVAKAATKMAKNITKKTGGSAKKKASPKKKPAKKKAVAKKKK